MSPRFSFAHTRAVAISLCWVLFASSQANPCLAFTNYGPRQRSREATVTVATSRVVNRFDPSLALGAAVDGKEKGMVDLQLSPQNIQMMRSAGLQSLIYRLRTELGNEVWHWNPHGTWSDPVHKRGYWISDPTPSDVISLSYGYYLPRRGNTIDQANNDGYSRLDDGDPESFWKSNPYLDQHFTHESNALHKQWVVIEFSALQNINALRLLWGAPFATVYRIQYADFEDISDIALSPPGMWHDFPRGVVHSNKGGDVFLRVAARPIKTRFLRILLEQSSNTVSYNSADVRDRLGFALREVYAGYVHKGTFEDLIHHNADGQKQTVMHVSSTDPWHSENDIDPNEEQPGLDRIFRDQLTNGLPMITPVGLLFDTPENAVNELRYLRSRGYSFDKVELGEEPDGQYAIPEDYGALYLQWSSAIHAIDPNLRLGGPSFQEIMPDTSGRKYKFGNSTWMRRFLDYLRKGSRLGDYNFFSFEWYPFDDVCEPVADQLARASDMLTESLREMRRQGVTNKLPWIISEYGYSAFATRAEISMEGALFNADVVGRFLTLGGDQAFLFGYAGSQPVTDQCTAGNNMLFFMDASGKIKYPYAPYFSARLLTEKWLAKAGLHELYMTSVSDSERRRLPTVSAYAVRRPDGLWSVLLINKDPLQTYKIRVSFGPGKRELDGTSEAPLELYQYSSAQYVLSDDASNPVPIKNDPPVATTLNNKADLIELPPYSLTVLRGRDN
ncbi:MAG TPA: discoidin domain-containing protein [Pyrinomonadaceae bacterium]